MHTFRVDRFLHVQKLQRRGNQSRDLFVLKLLLPCKRCDEYYHCLHPKFSLGYMFPFTNLGEDIFLGSSDQELEMSSISAGAISGVILTSHTCPVANYL